MIKFVLTELEKLGFAPEQIITTLEDEISAPATPGGGREVVGAPTGAR